METPSRERLQDQLNELRRRLDNLERSPQLGQSSIGQGGLRSTDFDGDRDDPLGDPGTDGWFLGADAAVFNTLVLRDQIIGPESLGISWDGDGESASNFVVPGLGGLVVTGSIVVPEWATRALVYCTVGASVRNDRASADFGYLRARIDGIGGGEVFDAYSASGGWGNLSASAIRLITDDLGVTIDVDARMRTDSGVDWTASTFHVAHIDAVALFKA